MDKWTRTPKHILRMHCLNDMIKGLPPLHFLEMGAGTGDFTKLFLQRGDHGTCYDLGKNNRHILRENTRAFDGQIIVVDSPDQIPLNQFDALFAFEVLEHIEDDVSALKDWSRHLRDGGVLIVSVPAHMRKYGKEDERVGHVRRYEKQQLHDLASQCGFDNITVRSYGFPLGNLSRIASDMMMKTKTTDDADLTMEEKSIKSGVERAGMVNKLGFLFNDVTLYPFILIQKWFYRFDLGDGYILQARKKANGTAAKQ